ncbi:riboflavin synthase [Paenibacillus aceti]|uniref:Riboflavin synthase n=1 Tax=Paenibacillus aceti TaxID=1820010 RepID=A0ABQ1W8V5_9BACL|nr:riboflavin synthase [Paenibacillus aceti]GGG20390.1 riboflavin synthase subunit alpha [Paenibacillus aceti]
MFTGIVEEIGTMKSIGRKGEAMVLGILASRIMDDVKLGDSIAVNGVCLTATSLEASGFTVDVMPQTYRHTNLKDLKPGSKINLERAMAAGGRFGGHIMQGHVDGTGTIASMRQDQNAVFVEIEPSDPALFRYIIPQGSIAIDGISLTVASVAGGRFAVSIIPHTWSETVLALKRTGDTVNLETDVLGKYVEHLLRFGRHNPEGEQPSGQPSQVDLSFLVENGFA